MDPLEERIRARQHGESALAQARLAKLPLAVALLRGLGVDRVWLFGSLTTGATHEGSDVDLMVSGLPSDERTNAWLALEELFEASVDLVPEEAASSPFRDAVYRRGREITSLGASMSPAEMASHFARHAYDVEPEPARMIEHGDRVARLQVALAASMAALVNRLRPVG